MFITMVGKPRNIPCANACRDIIQTIKTDALILVGIAGGNRHKKLNLGDVVAGDAILDIEGGRAELVPRVGLRLNYYRRDSWVNWLSRNTWRESLGRSEDRNRKPSATARRIYSKI